MPDKLSSNQQPPFAALAGYVLRVPAESVEAFEALLDLACDAAENACNEDMWSQNERDTLKAIRDRTWVEGHNEKGQR